MKFFIGLLLGIGIAAGIAFYLNKSQTPFVIKDVNTSESDNADKNGSSSPLILAPGTKMQEAASGTVASSKPEESNPKYDFYDVLEGKKNLSASQPVAAAPVAPANSKKTASSNTNNVQNILDQTSTDANSANGSYILQAGAFANSDSANDLKAHLALAGYATRIVSRQNANGTIINKVILGPYNSLSQAQGVKSELQQQNISVTIINTNQQGN